MSKPDVQLLFDGTYGDVAARFASEMRRERVLGVLDEDWKYLSRECVACSPETRDACPQGCRDGTLDEHDASDAQLETWDDLCNGSALVVEHASDDAAACDAVLSVARDADLQGDADKRDAVLEAHADLLTVYSLDMRDGDCFLIPRGMEWSDENDQWSWPRPDDDALLAFLRRVATITLSIEPESFEPSEHFDNARDVAWVREQVESGNEWGWCAVTLTAAWRDVSADDHLGACSYESRAAFEAPGGYHDDMVSTALGLLVDKIGSRPDLWGHVETDVARRT